MRCKSVDDAYGLSNSKLQYFLDISFPQYWSCDDPREILLVSPVHSEEHVMNTNEYVSKCLKGNT